MISNEKKYDDRFTKRGTNKLVFGCNAAWEKCGYFIRCQERRKRDREGLESKRKGESEGSEEREGKSRERGDIETV